MSKNTKEAAEARFAKLQAREREAAKAMSEVAAEAKRVEDNTARLKALRLARDAKLAEEAAVVAEAKAEAQGAAAKAKVKAKAAKDAARMAKDAARAAKDAARSAKAPARSRKAAAK